MSLGRQTLAIIICYVLSFLYIRGFLNGLKHYQLNKNAIKKRNKGQNFKEWFLYTRYREEIPQKLLNLYYFIVMLHLMVLILCLIFAFIKPLDNFGAVLAKGIFYFDTLWMTVIGVLFWQAEPGFNYKRWIKKKKSNKK